MKREWPVVLVTVCAVATVFIGEFACRSDSPQSAALGEQVLEPTESDSGSSQIDQLSEPNSVPQLDGLEPFLSFLRFRGCPDDERCPDSAQLCVCHDDTGWLHASQTNGLWTEEGIFRPSGTPFSVRMTRLTDTGERLERYFGLFHSNGNLKFTQTSLFEDWPTRCYHDTSGNCYREERDVLPDTPGLEQVVIRTHDEMGNVTLEEFDGCCGPTTVYDSFERPEEVMVCPQPNDGIVDRREATTYDGSGERISHSIDGCCANAVHILFVRYEGPLPRTCEGQADGEYETETRYEMVDGERRITRVREPEQWR